MKYNNDFRNDLEFGQMYETKFHRMLSEKKVEVKSDRQSMDTGNVFIEFSYKNEISGILKTEADYYAYYINDETCITMSVKTLIEKIRKLLNVNNAQIKSGGDGYKSRGVVTKIGNLLYG
jgi:hypothetical protein